MARTRRQPELRKAYTGDVKQAAKVFAAPPKGPMQSIHIVVRHNSYVDVSDCKFVCGYVPDGVSLDKRAVVAAPLDDPRFCPACLQARPHAVGSMVRVATVLLTC